jgi:amidase
MIPLVPSQDTAGVLARSVSDTAQIFSAIAGPDPRDTLTLSAPQIGPAITVQDGSAPLYGLRLGVARHVYFNGADQSEIERRIEHLLARAIKAGASLADPADIPTAAAVAELKSCVFRAEFKASLNIFLADRKGAIRMKSLADVIRFNKAHPDAIPFGQGLLEAAQAMSGDLLEPIYRTDRAKDVMLSRAAGLDAAFNAYRIDAIIVPGSTAAKMTGKAGYPVVTLPLGLAGTALGLIGRPFEDGRLLATAAALESLCEGWRPADLARLEKHS